MARWEPDARERLVRAAVDLFSEQGYDNTTVVQIAERAGLTKSTFFRHFPDKREVLSAGQEAFSALLTEGIATAPDSATPLEAVAAALDSVGTVMVQERRDLGPKLTAVVAGSPELRERNALKRARLAEAMAGALRQRGVADPVASVAAELGVLAFDRGYDRWVDPSNELPFAEVARAALDELRAAATALG
ncbi:MAG TPA: helix-turn-helix domain-containing protein [Pseudonocardiaceae bacterium]|nr:helix-turn-helix domain-containing protein [Pseudonocardiaceae bacterium]